MGILRILLALAVLIEHSGLSLHGIAVPGSIAVEAFFIISGFYIAMILDRKYQFPGGTRLFFQQRYLRLAPMYWFAILSTLAAGAFYGLLGHHPAGKYVIWAQEGAHLTPGAIAALCLSQITMLGQDAVMFFCLSGHPLALHFTPHWMTEPLPAIRFMLVPPAWSISVELLFYLSAPFLVRRSVRFQLTLVAITLTMRALSIIHWGLAYDPGTHGFSRLKAGSSFSAPWRTGFCLAPRASCAPAAASARPSRL